MNHIYRLVWNDRQQAYVAATENARSKGKSSSVVGTVLAGVVLALAGHAGLAGATQAANTLPTGGQVSAGVATISSSANTLTVDQSSQRAAINWNSFSVGSNATVNFNQPNANAITLNRVVGSESSVIDGAINANGNVWILNSSGILFNRSAQVNVGGLVASTLGMNDANFLAGSTTFEGNGSGGSILNLGTLQAANAGHIALLGQHVANEGVITATLGAAVLAAGDKVTLNFNGNSLVGVTIDRGVLNALVENNNAVIADGGQVILTAKGLDGVMATVVNNTGELRAQTIQNQEGKIYLLGGMQSDGLSVGGTLDVSAPNVGNGGFIETSAAHVNIVDGTRAHMQANAGVSGRWLIDPTDFNIQAGSGPSTSSSVGASTLSGLLASGDVTIQTLSSGSQSGDINVNGDVAWSAHNLSLQANGDINVNAHMSATGSSTLDMKAGFDGTNYDLSKAIRMGMVTNSRGISSFTGRIDIDRVGTGILTINGNAYTLINSIGSPGDESTGASNSLQGMANSANLAGYYALSSNVDASATSSGAWSSGSGFVPIGSSGTPFTGAFNGLGHVINGLYINRPSSAGVGFFGVASDFVISNVGFTGSSVTGQSVVGTLLGNTSYALTRGYMLTNIFAEGVVTGTDTGQWSTIGGLAGSITSNASDPSDSWVSNLIANVTVTSAGGSVGGLAAVTYGGGSYFSYRFTGNLGSKLTLTNLAAYGDVTSNFSSGRSDTGGLFGYLSETTLTYGQSHGNVQGADSVGGLVGTVDTMTSISRSFSTGNHVVGQNDVGGLVGSNLSSVQESFSTANVTATGNNAGGLIGRDYYWSLVWNGRQFNQSEVINTYATGTVTGGDYVGGLVGYQEAGTLIRYGYATAAVAGRGGAANVGAVLGFRETTGVGGLQESTFMTGLVNSVPVDGVNGLAVAQSLANMQNPLTFSAASPAWNIATDTSLASGLPVFRWATSGLTAGNSTWVIAAPAGSGNGNQAQSGMENQLAFVNDTNLLSQGPGDAVVAMNDSAGSYLVPPTFALREPGTGSPVNGAVPDSQVQLPQAFGAEFPDGVELALVSSPRQGELTRPVDLSQARTLIVPRAEHNTPNSLREVRVAASRHSQEQIVNGGVHLPDGVEQLFFVVQK